MISFKPFWETLDCYNISTYKLINDYHVSSSTINRLKHNKALSTATVDKLCRIERNRVGHNGVQVGRSELR